MRNIGDFFNKFEKLIKGSALKDEIIKGSFFKYGFSITKKDYSVRGVVLYVKNISPVVKTEMSLKKKDIMLYMQKNGVTTISDIR